MNLFTGVWLVIYYVLIYATLAGALLFPLLYGIFMRWWTREEGRHLFFYSLAVADAFLLIGARPIFGDFPGRAILSMFCLVSLLLVVWWRLALFARSYWRNRPSQRALGLTRNGGEKRGDRDGMER